LSTVYLNISMGSAWTCQSLALLLCSFFLFQVSTTKASPPPDRRVLKGHIPSTLKNAQKLDRLSGSKQLRLSVGLLLKNPAVLRDFLQNLYQPESPNYRQYLTPQKFTDLFGPSEADYRSTIQFLKSNGLEVLTTTPNRMLLEVRGSVADIEVAFGTRLSVYRHPTEARDFFAPEIEPSVESRIPILDIMGLNDFIIPHPVAGAFVPASDALHFGMTGSAPGGFFIGNDFRSAYCAGVTNTGHGQSVGLFELDGYFPADIGRYLADASMATNPILENVLLGGFDGTPGSGNVEVAMNIQLVLAMAPGLERVIVYQGPNINNVTTPNEVLNRMATDNRARQLSCSWGFSINGTTEQIFQQFAAQGQSFFQASSDSGAYSGPIIPPCDNPYVTSVGATALNTSANQWQSETVWSGSGGGVSTAYPIPFWQTNIDMTANHGSTTMRNFPDVSMIGEYIYVRGWDGIRYVANGTSASAPLWAGLAALINERALENDVSAIGFLNPALYNLAKGPAYGALFHDVTQGNNTNSSSPTKFFSVAGYDLCSGWGTPQASNFISALVPFNPLRISHLTGLSITGMIGEPFPASTLSLTNSGTGPLHWTVSNAAPWLKTSERQGSLAPGGTTMISVLPTYEAQYLGAGTHVTDLWFTNSNSGITQRRTVTLIMAPLIKNGDFELGTFSGWTLVGTTNENFVTPTSGSFPEGVHSRNWGTALGQSGSTPASLSQTIITSPGKQYALSFWLNSPDNPTPPRKTTPNQFTVKWNGTTLFNQTDLAVFSWTNFSFIVGATTTNTLLRFEFRNDPWAFGLDDVSIQPVPAPAFSKWVATENAFTLTWQTMPGVKYQLQSNYELLEQGWANVGNPFVATDSSMSISRPQGQYFYRVAIVPALASRGGSLPLIVSRP
jgi:hypothetical protein